MIMTLIYHKKEKEGIEEAARILIFSPRTVLVNLSANVTIHSTNAVSNLGNQAAFKMAVQREHVKRLISAIKI